MIDLPAGRQVVDDRLQAPDYGRHTKIETPSTLQPIN
jgi:hypothetical protein